MKLDIKKVAKANFTSTVAGGVVNFDMHAAAGERSTSYEKGRAVPNQEGVIDGKHGCFWRTAARRT